MPELLAVLKTQQAYSLAFHGTPDRNNVLSIFPRWVGPVQAKRPKLRPRRVLRYRDQHSPAVRAAEWCRCHRDPSSLERFKRHKMGIVSSTTLRTGRLHSVCPLECALPTTNSRCIVISSNNNRHNPLLLGHAKSVACKQQKHANVRPDNLQNCVFFVDEQGQPQPVPADYPVNDLVECLSADPQSEYPIRMAAA